MNVRFPVVLITAALAGLAGGVTSRLFTAENLFDRGTIRATRIELVDRSGRLVAFIGSDEQKDMALVFLDDKNRERAKFGVWPMSYSPKLVMTGGDGKDRVVFNLSRVDDRPEILLRDHESTRIHFGFHTNDAPSPMDEGWAIRFYGPFSPDALPDSLAAMEIGRGGDNKIGGFVLAKGEQGQVFSEPK